METTNWHLLLRRTAAACLADMRAQGRDTAEAETRLAALPDSLDALVEFSLGLADPSRFPARDDSEPDGFQQIMARCDGAGDGPDKHPSLPPREAARRARAGFLGAVCGCVLGKPIEEAPYPDLPGIRAALKESGGWPLRDYLSEAMLQLHGRRNVCWTETARERIRYAAPDDDITYKIIGMMLMEARGAGFTPDDIRGLWINHLPIFTTWGPERTLLLKAGIASLASDLPFDYAAAAAILNPGVERCGAMIRVDAYGYACPGNPRLAAELAWRDASWTHRAAGVYSAMFVAAAIAVAAVESDWHAIFSEALRFIPRGSRLHAQLAVALGIVEVASDWESCYDVLHARFAQFGPCQIVQELGTLMNSVRFAEDTADGFCKQVCQGNDTDSFGATAGSLLGVRFGPEGLDARWLAPFNDTLYTTMGCFTEHRLSAIADRMAALPERIRATALP